VELDLGGIAKGYAVDRVVEILRANGVNSALVSSGSSSIYALGAPPEEAAWSIQLRDPYEKDKSARPILLKNYSLAVSGNYEKFFTLGGKTYCHILDPRTGWPVQGMLMTAVLAPSATDSDATSTILFVLGAEGSRAYLKKTSNISALLFVPVAKGRYKQIALQSDPLTLPADSTAEFEAGPESP